jgi:hypothetical protein
MTAFSDGLPLCEDSAEPQAVLSAQEAVSGPRVSPVEGLAELHWYEAHGIGKKEFKRKAYLHPGNALKLV